MNRSKVLLIVQTVLMYLVQLPLTVMIALFYIDIDRFGGVIWNLILTSLIGNLVIVFPLGALNLIFALIGLFKRINSPYKTTVIIKLALIPWYVINFFFGFMLVAATLNPFLMLAGPLIIFILCAVTYIYMLGTSLSSYAYTIRGLMDKKLKINGYIICGFIFMAMFCLDIIGSFLLYYNEKEIEVSKEGV